MHRIFKIFAVATTVWSCSQQADFSAVERGFVAPPDSIRTGVYWYWINDNISKEGIVKDLHAMKQAGINRAFIGSNIAQGNFPFGKVKVLSDEWYDILHTALKTAGELDIQIGLFNCPGWSQSGGPWVKPEQAMRYLASSEIRVTGPAKISQRLPQPKSFFQDVKVIAFPVKSPYLECLSNTLPGTRIVRSKGGMKVSQPAKNPAQDVLLAGESSIHILLPAEQTARSMLIYPSGTFYAEVEIQAKEANGFRTVKQFKSNRTNLALNVGFEPLAPIAVTFPEIRSDEFRIIFRNERESNSIRDIILSPTPVVEYYAEKSLAKMFPEPLPYWHDYLWDQQTELKDIQPIMPQQVLDISQYMSADGILTWEAPEGEWIVMRTGMALTHVTNSPASPEGTGLEVDKMSKEHVAAHFDGFLGKIMERIPAEDRRTFQVVVEDSYETGGQNFTDGFMDDFRQKYGYDATPFLPVFGGHVIGNPEMSDRFLWDVRRLIADKVAYDYVGGLRDISHRYGLVTWLENYGHWGFPGEFLQYGGQSDEVAGEFWSEGSLGNIENRAASSCAHIYGKRNVWAESFTCGGNAYGRYPALMKRRGDWSFTEGINSSLLHVYIQQAYEDGYPGIDAWFGNEFNRKNTWFDHLDLFTTYLKRCNFMLQQGLNIADVAYFIGEDVPKMTGIRDPELPKGYSFDYINAEVILRDLTVKNGRLVLPHGTSYRILVLPPLETMRPEVLQKIEQLTAAGAVVLGTPPSRSPSMQGYPDADQQVRELAEKMWGDPSVRQRNYGKGTILTGMTMEEALASIQLTPDFLSDNDAVLYNHRSINGKEIYFVSNQSEQTIRIRAEFRVKGLQPELWDAVTGEIRSLPAFEQTAETTIVPLQLDAIGSTLIVFRKKGAPAAKDIAANFPEPEIIATVNTPYEVQFESDKVTYTADFSELKDWSQSDDERIRYYSGTAVYTTRLSVDVIPKDRTLYLDLGKVVAMAKVKVNGTYVGGAWTAPYRVNITDHLRQGENTLEIEVANTWKNRLIGDMRLPEKDRKVKSRHSEWKADSPLQESGLLGPVKIIGLPR
ncbi:MAG: glycoside hydrolase family 2 [Bacteroidales bacterium]|jgi:hypothetical protein|nr:glycoside hydrolase family 2 [Bacteroidales bacterium]